MNIIFLKTDEIGERIPRSDRRYVHITRVLKKRQGDVLAAGCSDCSTGQARIESLDSDGFVLSYAAEREAPPLRPVRLMAGFPRPIQAGRILKDLTSLGIASVWFSLTDSGEKSYAESDFFRKKEFEFHLVQGAEQSGNPRLPEIRTFWSIDRACDALDEEPGSPCENSARLLPHVDSTLPRLSQMPRLDPPVTLAIGSERGWTDREIDLLRGHGFQLCYLGDRVLKTETAALAAVSIVLSRLGYM